jgi:hypothetical protein
MALKRLLKPEGSLAAGVATMGVVYAVYSHSLPSQAEMHATSANDDNIEAGRKKAIITSSAVVGAISLIAKDPVIFILGSFTAVGLDFMARHANATSPETGKLVAYGSDESMASASVTQMSAVS